MLRLAGLRSCASSRVICGQAIRHFHVSPLVTFRSSGLWREAGVDDYFIDLDALSSSPTKSKKSGKKAPKKKKSAKGKRSQEVESVETSTGKLKKQARKQRSAEKNRLQSESQDKKNKPVSRLDDGHVPPLKTSQVKQSRLGQKNASVKEKMEDSGMLASENSMKDSPRYNGDKNPRNKTSRRSDPINIEVPRKLLAAFQKVEEGAGSSIELLAKAVNCESVSGTGSEGHGTGIMDMASLLRKELGTLGYEVRMKYHPSKSSPSKDVSPIILATPPNFNAAKKSVLFYGNYDVTLDAETTSDINPFQLGKSDGILSGRGVANAKGPITGWIAALKAFKAAASRPDVNVFVCLEGQGEVGSGGLEECIVAEKDGFFKDIDAVVVSGGHWLSEDRPAITYGFRGCHHYSLTVNGSDRDLHSGQFGGIVREPLQDLIHVLSALTDVSQSQIFPILGDKAPLHVAEPSQQEVERFSELKISVEKLRDMMGVAPKYAGKLDCIQHMWREPSLSVHGIEGAFSQPGASAVIPHEVTGKFSIRTVPNMDMDSTDMLVTKYIKAVFGSLRTTNKMKLSVDSRNSWWLSDHEHWNYEAATMAARSVWKVEPELTREGGASPVALLMEKHLGANVLSLPISKSYDNLSSAKETLDEVNYINGIKNFCAYLYYAGLECSQGQVEEDEFISSDNLMEMGYKPKPEKPKRVSSLDALINIEGDRAAKASGSDVLNRISGKNKSRAQQESLTFLNDIPTFQEMQRRRKEQVDNVHVDVASHSEAQKRISRAGKKNGENLKLERNGK